MPSKINLKALNAFLLPTLLYSVGLRSSRSARGEDDAQSPNLFNHVRQCQQNSCAKAAAFIGVKFVVFKANVWTIKNWEEKRWGWIYSFPSPLALALGRGGKVTDWQGDVYDRPDSDGQLVISLRGGEVTLTHPKDWPERGVDFTIRPKLDIVRLLLAYGAPITDVELNAAQNNPNQEFLHALEVHKRNPTHRSHPPAIVELRVANATLAAQVQRLTQRVVDAETRAAAAERWVQSGFAEYPVFLTNGSNVNSALEETEQNTAALQARNSDLDFEITSIRNDAASLHQQSTTLLNRNRDLDHEATILRQNVASLHEENSALCQNISALQHENVSMKDAITSLQSQTTTLLNENLALRFQGPPTSQATFRPPACVRKMMYAIAQYVPQDVDELPLAVGDKIAVSLAFADGWGLGRNIVTQITGCFPLSHLAPNPPAGLLQPSNVPGAVPATTSRLDSLPRFAALLAPSSVWKPDVVGPPPSSPFRATGRRATSPCLTDQTISMTSMLAESWWTSIVGRVDSGIAGSLAMGPDTVSLAESSPNRDNRDHDSTGM
ncbi:hypothetical protein M427DRAFT_43014 [Gonapodya prolifera JEL478]|uniref:SH3 domain-containing protein n=1 Tax=Gonapodya prolifera (strain JEL478) TaxID=1344416 RepID=A0A139AKJ7_GONPJ|nr:hypothetical protein M427DRAFT_43014 [Gonapodya prolifera JEL478]|eukprot:KXS17296.1 hypothetical protein M427DRAFT_43014 [Gonapodya prolifera JEL478]